MKFEISVGTDSTVFPKRRRPEGINIIRDS